MRFSLFTFCLFAFAGFLSGQSLYTIEEKLKFGPRVSRDGAMIFLKLPKTGNGQQVSAFTSTAAPTTSPAMDEVQEYTWRGEEIGEGDTLQVTYRITKVPTPAWTEEMVDSLQGRPIEWPPLAPGEDVDPYILPPLVLENVGQTEFSTLDRGDTTLEDIHRLITRLDRRIVTLRDPEKFNITQPLLEDVYRLRTTPRRKHLLLSLALQYLDVPHRVVAGKILSYGEVRENELWVELPVAGKWYRVYYGDGINRNEWMPPEEPDLYLACSYDWRDLTMEIISAPDAPPIPSLLFTKVRSLILEFWDKKNEAVLKGNYVEAISMIDSVLVHVPGSVAAITEKGLILTEAGRPQVGLSYFQLALQQAKEPADRSFTLVQFAQFYSLDKKGEEAVEALVRAYQIAPFNIDVLYRNPRFDYLTRQRKLMDRLLRTLRRLQ